MYKGVTTFDKNENSNGEKCLHLPSFEWKTLATNLEEFRKVVVKIKSKFVSCSLVRLELKSHFFFPLLDWQDEFSSSKVVAETAVCRTIQAEAIPFLEKIQKVNF